MTQMVSRAENCPRQPDSAVRLMRRQAAREATSNSPQKTWRVAYAVLYGLPSRTKSSTVTMAKPTDRKAAMSRAFTLVELMVVVVIVGVLSVLAMVAYRKYAYSARSSEVHQFLGAVRAAQESYFQSFGQYCGSLQPARWPADLPVEQKAAWEPVTQPVWVALNLRSPGAVWFQYFIVAGTSTQAPPGNAPFFQGEVENRPWFWVGACGDFDGDAGGDACTPNTGDRGNQSFFETSSLRAHIVSYREGE